MQLQASENGEASMLLSSQDLQWMRDYATFSLSGGATAVPHLQRIQKVLSKAHDMISRGKTKEFVVACNLVPPIVKRLLHTNLALAREEASFHEVQGHVLEVLCALVELTVGVLSCQARDDKPKLGLRIVARIMEALSIALDRNSQYYEWRKSTGTASVNVVLPPRLTAALEVPGFSVLVAGEDGTKLHHRCCNKGVNFQERRCECCEPPGNADAVLVYLHWLLAKTASGRSGYESMTTILSSPKRLSLPTVSFLLGPLHQLIWEDAGTNTWRQFFFQHVEANCKSKFKDRCVEMCFQLSQYLKHTALGLAPVPVPQRHHAGLEDALFIVVLNKMHRIACWGLSSGLELYLLRGSLGQLQEVVCERLLDARENDRLCYIDKAVSFVGAAIEATSGPFDHSGNEPLVSLTWLRERGIIWKLLNVSYGMCDVPEVHQFLAILAKKGLIVEETDFCRRLQHAEFAPDTLEEFNAADLINATMLELLDFSAYSDGFVRCALDWMEARQAETNSVIDGARIFNILRKLLKSDKNRSWKDRFCAVLRKCASSESSHDLLKCLSEVAGHYDLSRDATGSSADEYLQVGDFSTKLLVACSSADTVTSLLSDLTDGSHNQAKLYIEKVQSWKEKEMKLHMQLGASSQLTQALSTALPWSRHEMAQKCLDRLILAKHFTVDLNSKKSDTLASAIATTMSPELQTLEALKNESTVQCEVAQKIANLRARRLEDLDGVMQEQYRRLVKFVEAWHEEEEEVVWDALQRKSEVISSVERAGVSSATVATSEDILTRLFLNAHGACKQLEDKCKEAQPNAECVVCYSPFSLKRKRACLDPCGHASTCVDCATREWKRTKSCSLCKASIGKPIQIPHKLFF